MTESDSSEFVVIIVHLRIREELHALDLIQDFLRVLALWVNSGDHAQSLIVVAVCNAEHHRILREESLKGDDGNDLAEELNSEWDSPQLSVYLGLLVISGWQCHADKHCGQNSEEKEGHADSSGPADQASWHGLLQHFLSSEDNHSATEAEEESSGAHKAVDLEQGHGRSDHGEHIEDNDCSASSCFGEVVAHTLPDDHSRDSSSTHD